MLQVKDGDKAIRYLNELEWVEGEIWANVWQTECIARINPSTGSVRFSLLIFCFQVCELQSMTSIQAALHITPALQMPCWCSTAV